MPNIDWEVHSPEPLDRVELYRNGFCIHTTDCRGLCSAAGGFAAEVSGIEDTVSFFVAAYDRDGRFAISSPIWVQAEDEDRMAFEIGMMADEHGDGDADAPK